MGIHYDYKSTRNEKALKKEAKRKARIEERRAKKGTDSEIKDGHVIASLSLGQPRLFQFKGIKTTDMHQMFLENGSLVIFDIDAGKKMWKHRLPKQSKLTEGRINLTFRLE